MTKMILISAWCAMFVAIVAEHAIADVELPPGAAFVLPSTATSFTGNAVPSTVTDIWYQVPPPSPETPRQG
ncbi:MAG: hypothetical protein O6941_05255 [Planctomycetota bacterium]|nr:hypothetical protein [Planctomycetota bacterium]